MKKLVAIAMGLAMSTATFAQDEVETTISTDVVSHYVWRGQDLGGASVQPTLGVAYKGLSLSAWGSVGITNPADAQELDLTLAYTLGKLNIGITDYWTNTAGGDPEARYFKYDAHGTNHVFEANIGYDFGVASLQWFTNFGGKDGLNKDGKRAYSSYVEAAVPFKFASVDWTATAGAVPFATDFYNGWTSGFAVTSVALKATKDVRITDTFTLPVFAEVSGNPRTQMGYFVLGLTLIP